VRILDPNRWRQTAQIEPGEYFRHSVLGMWLWEAIIVAVLGAMAYWDVPVKWMIPVATILVIHEMCGSIRESTYRLEGVRQLLENQSRE
jgi:hypothetical protein